VRHPSIAARLISIPPSPMFASAIGDAVFSREILASHPHHVLAIRFSCNKPGRIGFRMGFGKSILPGSATAAHDTLVFQGHAYEHMHSSGHDGVALQIHARLITAGGTVTPAGGHHRSTWREFPRPYSSP